MEGEYGSHTNVTSVLQQGEDDLGHANMPSSSNHKLNGNAYHAPDYSKSSGFNVIDFPMHWRFHNAENAFNVRSQDNLYNDATYNVVYVDSHDYGPNGQDRQRFAGGTAAWAENLDLMFTWRGIPCIFYGSEVEFQAGKTIDEGPNLALKNTGRAYFGGYLEGDVSVTDFAQYSKASGNMAHTLTHPLARHIRHLNQIRAAVPALRKGQYSTDGCSGKMAFKRRYTDSKVDSYVLVTISGSANFSGIENGTYTDCVTGDVKTVTNGTLTADCSGKGNMRVYVLSTAKTKAPGKIGEEGKFLYGSAPVNQPQEAATGALTPEDTVTKRDNEPGNNQGGGNGDDPTTDPVNPINPERYDDEYCAFFESSWDGAVYAWVWAGDVNYTGGSWPGVPCQNLGNNVWKWSLPIADATIGSNPMIIFSANGKQTKDLNFVNGGYYKGDQLVKTIESSGSRPENGISSAETAVERTIVAIYDMFGRQVKTTIPGTIYIVRYSDGSSAKLLAR